MKLKEDQKVARLFLLKKNKMTEIVIRTPKKGDLEDAWKFYNKVIKETSFLSRLMPVKLVDEKKWLNDTIISNKKKKSINLFAVHDGKIVGSCDVHTNKNERMKHVGTFGICILQDYTRCGLGTKLTQTILGLAKKELKIKIAELSVYSNNLIAQRLYRKIGFVHAGKIPKGIRQGKKFVDNIIMYKVLK
ncbi:N-acetyltransferase [archaeon]|nr:N-acetyltransferase [archaeon]